MTRAMTHPASQSPPAGDRPRTVADAAGRPSRPTAEQARNALARILASKAFRRSARASGFLRYVVQETLAGNGHRLKALTIAIDVYERPADHNIHSDPTVRVEASRVRTRLEQYYADEGQNDPVRIELHRGRYVPSIVWADSPARPPSRRVAQTTKQATPVASDRAPRPARHRFGHPATRQRLARATLAILAGAVLLAAVAWATTPASTNAAPLAADIDGAPQSPEAVAGILPTELAATGPFLLLPVAAIGNGESNRAFAAGLSDELRTRLDPLRSGIASGESAAPDEQAPLSLAADADAARFVLRSSVRTSGTKRRLVFRLVELQTGRQVWARQIEQPVRGESSLRQAQIAAEVASLLGNDAYGVLLSATDNASGATDSRYRMHDATVVVPSARLNGIVARLR